MYTSALLAYIYIYDRFVFSAFFPGAV